jgi:hypothetical protein
MSAETQIATEAVAKARGIAFRTASQNYRSEVRYVREYARGEEEAGRREFEDAAFSIAKSIVRSEEARKREREEKRRSKSRWYISVQATLSRVRQLLRGELDECQGVEWDEDERELILDTFEGTKRCFDLLEMSVRGTEDVDWDEELRKIS